MAKACVSVNTCKAVIRRLSRTPTMRKPPSTAMARMPSRLANKPAWNCKPQDTMAKAP